MLISVRGGRREEGEETTTMVTVCVLRANQAHKKSIFNIKQPPSVIRN
jgi:hypothetical protein